jgi:CCR4-NOT transcription complex subunit 3
MEAVAALSAAAASAAVIIPEPILPNSWVPLSAQQLRYNAAALTASLSHLPESSDSERPKGYVPKQPFPTHPAFPQTPSPAFDAPALFERFSTDTLFFIFYYNQGSYHQYLAARELRRHAWRFHKRYATWFLRGEEPKVRNEAGETGTYYYFDFESGWCERFKRGFTFEYAFLEDELT